MRIARRHSTRGISAAGASVVLAVVLTSCAPTPAPPRARPDRVESAAVAIAQGSAIRDGVPINRHSWTQLWTPQQAGPALAECLLRASGGAVVFTPAPVALNRNGLSGDIAINGNVEQAPDFTDTQSLQGLQDSCLATVPVDDRSLSVPERDRAALYAYDVTFLRRCLLAHGQTVSRMPTRERFVNLPRASAPWSPYDQVRVATRTQWYALADACPAFPPAIAGDIAAVTASATTP